MGIYIALYGLIFLNFLITSAVKKINFLNLLLFFFLIFFIGLRDKVGGDWDSYLRLFQQIHDQNLFSSLLSGDPAYVLIEQIADFLGLGIYGVNFVGSVLFFYSFYIFAKSFKIDLSFALLIAFPYLIMVVVQGYTRQGVALGLVMALYASFHNKEFKKSILFYILAILFHKTAIIAGVIYLSNKKYLNWKTLFLLVIIVLVMYKLVIEARLEYFIRGYFINKMHSNGAFVRILVNVFAALLLFLFAKSWKYKYDDYQIWKLFGVISIFILIFTLTTNATTIGDRIMLYFYPLQIVVFVRLLYIIKDKNMKYIYFMSLLVMYWSILLVWLNYAVHRDAWMPYDNLLLKFLE